MSRRRRPSEPQTAVSTATVTPIDWRDHVLAGVTVVLILLASVRCLVPVTSNLYWDDDPRRTLRSSGGESTDEHDIPPQFFGVAEVAILDTLSLAAGAVAIAVHVLFGGAVRWASALAAIIGAVFCLIHARTHIDNTFHCGAWMGGIALGLGALHLASRPRQRRWILAALFALAVPLMIDATRFVFVDHAESIAYFKENESEWLKARGWEHGSPEHLMYVRRMEFGEPTGAFTFSNILGSVAAAIAVGAGVITIGLWRVRSTAAQRWVLPLIVALLALWTTYLTRSKGAPVAAVMTAGMIGLALVFRRKPWLPRVLPVTAVSLVFAALALVVLRGMQGPPSDEHGERSLLFRWHYWQAAARIATASPQGALLGVGPAQFADDYHWAKNPLNPEEIRSAHNVFVDLIACLGVGGLLLSLVLLGWFSKASREAASTLSNANDDPAPELMKTNSARLFEIATGDFIWSAVLIFLLFGCEIWIRGPLYAAPGRFLSWSAGLMGAMFVLALSASPRWRAERYEPMALLAAAAVLLIHAQIEMTFFQASSAPLAWLILGAAGAGITPSAVQAGAATNPPAARTSFIAFAPAIVLIILAIVHAVLVTGPTFTQQKHLREAAAVLRVENARGLMESTRELALAMHGPPNPRVYEWHSRLSMELAAGIKASLRDVPREKVTANAKRAIEGYALDAIGTLAKARAQGLDTVGLHRQHAQMLTVAADVLADPKYLDESLAAWRALIVRRPYAWQDRVELADLLWKLDRHDEARAEYRKALELSDGMYLEPTRMMATIERRRIESRLRETP